MVARLLGCLALLALSVHTLLSCRGDRPPGGADTVYKHLFVGCPEVLMTVPLVNLLLLIFFYNT